MEMNDLDYKTLSPLWLNQKPLLLSPQNYWKINMPATRTSHSSSSSLSSFSISPCRQILSGPTNLTFSEFLALFENDNDYEQLVVTLFECHDFIIKTNAMRHVAELIRHFQDEIDEQQDYIQSIFIKMERAGLHELLNQDYKRTGGTIH